MQNNFDSPCRPINQKSVQNDYIEQFNDMNLNQIENQQNQTYNIKISSSQQNSTQNINNLSHNEIISEGQDSTQCSPTQLRMQIEKKKSKKNRSRDQSDFSCEQDMDSQDDEIKEDESNPISSQYFPNSCQNSNNNLNYLETQDSLSKHAQQSSMQNLSKRDINTYNKAPIDISKSISQKSCNLIEFQQRKQKKKNGLQLQLKKDDSSDAKKDNSSDPSPSRIIQKRVSMFPTTDLQGHAQRINSIEQQYSPTGRRKSLPEFSELEQAREPEYDYNDPDHMYKIYCGDAIDEGGQQDGFCEDGFAEDGFAEDGFEEDGIDEGEQEKPQHDQKRHSKNPMDFIKSKPKFSSDDYDDEDPAETPIKKFSKFEEDRQIVQQSKMENGGITPQKYLQTKDKFNFK